MATIPKFANAPTSFHADLKSRVAAYFETQGAKATGDHRLFIKTIALLLFFAAVYIHLVFFTPVALLAWIECIGFGALIAAIGFNVMHDGGHGSFSTRKSVSQIAAHASDLLGGSSYIWNLKHNIVHHSYTNVDGVDDDIDAQPFLRMTSSQTKFKFHRYQHWYFWFFYSFLYVFWVFFSDYQKYFSRKIGDIPLSRMRFRHQLAFWGFKALHAALFVVIPIYKLGWASWLVGFATCAGVAGFVLSIVFQLAHTVKDTEFPKVDSQTGRLENDWAIHQIKTTANFATRNRFLSWYVGGLNFQIEHHLFPKISHVHYPAISAIVKQACVDHQLTYIEYPTLLSAISSHLHFLQQVGNA